jgi:hypothetical protein
MDNNDIDKAKKIIWLASYPKSGNTWFRAFLTALLNDGELDINEMKTDGIFSSRPVFDNFTDLDSTYLYDEEVKVLLPEVFINLEKTYEKENLFIKIHDAYTYNQDNQPIVPTECTRCAIYFIRNPLDVVGSFANHNNSTIDQAITLMSNDNGFLAKQSNNLNIYGQFKQLMLSWSGHVESWTNNLPFPVLVIRYEDMIADTLTIFSEAVNFMGIAATKEQIKAAINTSSFEQLQKKEKEKGFKEKYIGSPSFFRKGKAGNWEHELNSEQINDITSLHKKHMELYNYL